MAQVVLQLKVSPNALFFQDMFTQMDDTEVASALDAIVVGLQRSKSVNDTMVGSLQPYTAEMFALISKGHDNASTTGD